ncbi:MAG TPA: radical SAM protein [Actinobacteria bacterium]|nr:radical SAM protein [Actinomycetota bacterium]
MNLNKIISELKRITFVVPRLPVRAQIEVTNRCNLSCKMCLKLEEGTYKDIAFENFESIMEQLSGIQILDLTSWGEPLLHPNFVEMVAYTSRKGIEPHFATNGTLLDAKMQKELIDAGIKGIIFSIDVVGRKSGEFFGHPPSKKVLDNLESLLKFREGKTPRVSISTCLYEGFADDLFGVVEYAGMHGVDGVNILRVDIGSSGEIKRYSWEEEQEILKEAGEIGKKAGIKVWSMFEAYRGYRKWVYRDRYLCPQTYDSIYITHEGDVVPCCKLSKLKMGNLFENNLSEIWLGDKFCSFRKNQLDYCGKCDIFKYRYKEWSELERNILC